MKYSLKHIDREAATYNISNQPEMVFIVSPANSYLNLSSHDRDIAFDTIINRQHEKAELTKKEA